MSQGIDNRRTALCEQLKRDLRMEASAAAIIIR
jgi:hypothetical protein